MNRQKVAQADLGGLTDILGGMPANLHINVEKLSSGEWVIRSGFSGESDMYIAHYPREAALSVSMFVHKAIRSIQSTQGE